MSNDGLPRNYDAWLQAPYQNQKEYEYRCTNCEKHFDEDIKRCTVCDEKVEEIDDSDPFGRNEPEYNNEDR